MKCIAKDQLLDNIMPSFKTLLKKYEVADRIAIFPEFTQKERLQLLFFTIAICHHMNWKYLCNTAMYRMYTWSLGWQENQIQKMTYLDMESFFCDYPKKHKIDAKRRTNMVKKIAKYLQENPNTLEVIQKSDRVVAMLEILKQVPVYKQDPMQKKSNLLVQTLLEENLIQVQDPDKIEPLVEYHIMRLYLRTGRIQIENPSIEQAIRKKECLQLSQITKLRREIAKQIKRFCSKYHKTVRQLNRIDWYIARNYCTKEHADCFHCPLQQDCMSSGKPVEDMLMEPIDQSGFY